MAKPPGRRHTIQLAPIHELWPMVHEGQPQEVYCQRAITTMGGSATSAAATIHVTDRGNSS